MPTLYQTTPQLLVSLVRELSLARQHRNPRCVDLTLLENSTYLLLARFDTLNSTQQLRVNTAVSFLYNLAPATTAPITEVNKDGQHYSRESTNKLLDRIQSLLEELQQEKGFDKAISTQYIKLYIEILNKRRLLLNGVEQQTLTDAADLLLNLEKTASHLISDELSQLIESFERDIKNPDINVVNTDSLKVCAYNLLAQHAILNSDQKKLLGLAFIACLFPDQYLTDLPTVSVAKPAYSTYKKIAVASLLTIATITVAIVLPSLLIAIAVGLLVAVGWKIGMASEIKRNAPSLATSVSSVEEFNPASEGSLRILGQLGGSIVPADSTAAVVLSTSAPPPSAASVAPRWEIDIVRNQRLSWQTSLNLHTITMDNTPKLLGGFDLTTCSVESTLTPR